MAGPKSANKQAREASAASSSTTVAPSVDRPSEWLNDTVDAASTEDTTNANIPYPDAELPDFEEEDLDAAMADAILPPTQLYAGGHTLPNASPGSPPRRLCSG